MRKVPVIGAGLAGSECAWQLANRGIPVRLYEMRPERLTPAHHTGDFGELVCSNSLRSDELTNAVGLLKEEMRRLDSLILSAAGYVLYLNVNYTRIADGVEAPNEGATLSSATVSTGATYTALAYNVGFGVEGTVLSVIVLSVASLAIWLWGRKHAKPEYDVWS